MDRRKMKRKTLTDHLIQSAARSRAFLDRNSRLKLTDFILSRQNPDGGFQGRDAESDLYYTVFGVASLKALGHPVHAGRIWKYARSFGMGEGLDLVHLVCLIRLKVAFPMLGKTRRKLFQQLENFRTEEIYDLVMKLLGEDCLASAGFPDEPLLVSPTAPTTNLAAALIVNRTANDPIVEPLLSRFADSGGFKPNDTVTVPDLLSTAVALFALTFTGVKLGEELQVACFKFIESLWRDSGGFSGHIADQFEDVEYTFYALLSIGCLIHSMAKDYGSRAGT